MIHKDLKMYSDSFFIYMKLSTYKRVMTDLYIVLQYMYCLDSYKLDVHGSITRNIWTFTILASCNANHMFKSKKMNVDIFIHLAQEFRLYMDFDILTGLSDWELLCIPILFQISQNLMILIGELKLALFCAFLLNFNAAPDNW